MERGIVMPSLARLLELTEIFGSDAASPLTEASGRSSDQAKYIGQLLSKLGSSDLTMVAEIVKWLAGSLDRR